MRLASRLSRCALLVLATAFLASTTAVADAERSPSSAPSSKATSDAIDRLVLARLESLGIRPSPRCSDEVFLRRAFLDLIATLPTVEEARAFLSDRSPDKRDALVDRLLAR